MKRITWIIIVVCCFRSIVFSQSGHYWTQQYGTRSMLLSGSVIGGVEDLGAVYYNPARLGFIENPAFLLSADVYQWSRLKFEDALGENVNFNKSEFDGVPSLAAGTFKLGFLPNHHFAYAILSRQRTNLNFDYREETFGDVIGNWDGNELFEGEIGLNTKIQEDWFGGSWSHALNEKISFGASGFFVVNENNKGSHVELRALTEENELATYNFNRNFNFKTYSLIWKLGAAFKFNKVNLGITLTTPAVNLSGDSNYNYQLYFSGIEGVSTSDDIYSNSYQEDLKTLTKTPLAIGVGSTFILKRSKLHLSAEYYSGITGYTVFQAQDHFMQSRPDSVISFHLTDQMNSVINGGVGIEWKVSEKVSAYVSFSTDFSAAIDETSSFLENKPEINNSTLKADFYHYGAGIVLAFKGADITLGATRTGSSQDIARPVSFPEEGDNVDEILDPDETATLKWTRWRFVFSFSVPFLKEYADEKLKKLEGKKQGD